MFRQNKKMIVGVVIALLMAVSMLSADVPNLIDYQGRLADAGGSPVNGNVSILFSIYDVEIGGIALWSETQGTVDVIDGLFQVTLGTETTLPENLFDEENRWVEIKVGTDAEMSPRTKINSVPFAITDGDWVKSGNDIYSAVQGNVGIGIGIPIAKLQIVKNGVVPAVKVQNNEGPALEVEGKSTFSGNGGSESALVVNGFSEFLKAIGAVSSGDETTVEITQNGSGKALHVNGFSEFLKAIGAVSSGDETTVTAENTGSGSAAEFDNDSATSSTVEITQNGSGKALVVNGFSEFLKAIGAVSSGYSPTAKFTNTNTDGDAFETNGTYRAYPGEANQYAVVNGGKTCFYSYNTDGEPVFEVIAPDPGTPAALLDGDTHVNGTLTATDKAFLIDHPLDPANKYLYHACVESPDRMNVYNGNVILDNKGEAIVELPHYFETLNMEFRYQLTPLGASAPDLYIAEEIRNNEFKIAGGKSGLKVSWQVTGIRNDPYAKEHRMIVEKDKPAKEKGKYLHPELYGQGEEKGMRYEEKMKIMNSRKK